MPIARNCHSQKSGNQTENELTTKQVRIHVFAKYFKFVTILLVHKSGQEVAKIKQIQDFESHFFSF